MRTYELILRPKASFLTPLQADTIFGSICWALRYIEGEEKLKEFLEEYETSPPLIVSNGFPTGFFPKPLTQPFPRKEVVRLVESLYGEYSKENAVETIKKLKKIKKEVFVSREVFEKLIDGNSEFECLKNRLIGEQRSKIHGADSPGRQSTDSTFYKNSINRLTGKTKEEGGLFTQDETFYSPGSTISIFIKTDRYDKEYIEKIFKFIEYSGFGKRKSTGKGHFVVEKVAEYDFKAPENPNAFVSLSSFVPAAEDPSEGWYDLFVKYGKLGGHYASSGNPFKKPLCMLKAGSVFRDDKVKDYYGRLVENIHSDREIRHYGYAFAVGMRI